MFLEAALEDDFGGFQRLQQFVDVFGIAFGEEKFAGRDVEEGDAESRGAVAACGRMSGQPSGK
jgi:hypothetical protein